jgi:glutaminase
MDGIQAILDDIRGELDVLEDRGKVATYIPELAKIDLRKFAIAVATVDGQVFTVGDESEPFSIQSISKVFTLTLALGRLGNALWRRVGREPSGSAFNSIVQLEHEKGIPRNPFVNAGAMVVTDTILAKHQPSEVIAEILQFMRFLCDDPSIMVDPAVAKSETETGFRNAALANYMRGFGNLDHPPALTLGVYFHQCAIAMTCRQLALAGLYLANGGVSPVTNSRIISNRRARRINSLMLTCGHYDGSGDFAFRVGLPGKSGVGGGIIAIHPGQFSIAVWSPRLNKRGNSYRGMKILEILTTRTRSSIF